MTGVQLPSERPKGNRHVPQNFRKVAEALKGALGLHKSRADCSAAFIITAVEAKSILLGEAAKRLPGTARGKSKFHRLQDFFREVRLDWGCCSFV